MRQYKLFVLLFLSVFNALLSAQTDSTGQKTADKRVQKNFISLRGTFPFGISGSFTQINKEWGWSIIGSYVYRNAAEKPDDYLPASLHPGIILDRISYLSAHYVWEAPKHWRRVHFGLEAGPAYFYINTAEDFVPQLRQCVIFPVIYQCESNYSYSRKGRHLVGLSSRAKVRIDEPLAFLGLEMSIVGLYNPKRPYIGAELALIIGDLD